MWCCPIYHALLESCSWYGFAEFSDWFFRSLHQVLETYVLDIEENHLTWQLSWKLSYNLRTTILYNMRKKLIVLIVLLIYF